MTTLSRFPLVLFIICLVCSACSKKVSPQKSQADMPGPKCIIYKTKSDYSHFVPVGLSPDKSKIVSYPDVKDIYFNGQLAYPTPLTDGYLLDNRGIGPDVAFLKLTYEEYSKLEAVPPAGELFNMILDKDPLTRMYECGLRSQYKDPAGSMDQLIRSGDLRHKKRLK
jgi:hypothetical protein